MLFCDWWMRKSISSSTRGQFWDHVKDEPWEQQKLGASRVSSIPRVKNYCPTTAKHFKKEIKLGASVVIIPTQSKGSCFLFLLDELDSIFEYEFFDKMRASSLRLAENREVATWLGHSRFLASFSAFIHESFVKKKLLCWHFIHLCIRKIHVFHKQHTQT